MTTTAEASKKIRAALKTRFPGTKFTVALSAGCSITWTDEGPSVVQVEDALLAAGCGEAEISWNDKRYIRIDTDRNNDTLHFDRYNAAERTAYQQDLERRIQEQAARQQREDAAVKQALQAKRAAVEPLRWQGLLPVSDPAISAAFETLRQRAEAEVTIAEDAERRPSWAPPLVLGQELAEVCLELGYLTEHDKLIGRLWATFATPKRSGRYLREHVSHLPLHGIQCRDFQLYAGGTRGSRTALLFEAQRLESGDWRFGPREWPSEYSSPRRYDWERLIREREHCREEVRRFGEWYTPEAIQDYQRRIDKATQQIEAIDAQDVTDADQHRKHQSLRQQALELAGARVLDFIDAPDVQMQLAARLCGHCCVCFKELADPISLERGIGPDCLQHRIDFIKKSAQNGRSLEYIVMWSGMPSDFVTAVLNEG